MGMKAHAAFADTVTNEFVKETCPKYLAKLQELLDGADIDLDYLGQSNHYGGDLENEITEEVGEKAAMLINVAYQELQLEFHYKTGLDLNVKFWDEDCEGQTEGSYWEVEGIYGLTPAGIANKGNFERQDWTTFG